MIDDASGANWKFKATLSGGFKIRDHANGLDVIVIEPNSSSNLLYIDSEGNIGIGTSSPDNSALLDLASSNKGFLPPRMTSSQRATIDSPAAGFLVFQTDAPSGYYYYTGSAWITINAPRHYVGELWGGGVIFWVDQTGEHGLICNMIDLSTSQVWSNVNSLIGPTAQSDWNGLNNSNAIVGQPGQTNSASKLCLDYTNADYGTGIYSDWYLPSRSELIDLWSNLKAVHKALESDGNPATTLLKTDYWSSTESTWESAWCFNFGSGVTNDWAKGSSLKSTRAIRAF